MGRIVGGVIAGYVTMFVGVFILFSLAWMVLGADGAFHAGSWDVSAAWIGLSIVIGFLAAVAGGYLCALIARNPRGPQSLVVVVVVLGLLMALPVLFGAGTDAPAVRPAAVGMFEAMQYAQQPGWTAVLNPLLGALGVVIGARTKTGN